MQREERKEEVKVEIFKVSIPQAVSTVATKANAIQWDAAQNVSIPQAVSTVATAGPRKPVFMGLKIRF